ncbi:MULTISPECIES: FkbM family methyltransferase [Alphaproteobacteria]|uniref:FkbM family methyltransferase n=1 Tax=Alphaproteobacteria TaxID=28211 RepID=UPI0014792DC3|nr:MULTISPECIES: FkbM family methyltransferase [Alphaproteobacteria]
MNTILEPGTRRSRVIEVSGRSVTIFGDSEYFEKASELSIPHLAPVCQMLPKDGICLDVGANIGLTAFYISLCVPEGTVYAFEPVPATFADLVAGIERNDMSNVKAFHLAVGESSRPVLFRNLPKFSSGNFQILPGTENSRILPTIEVESVTLDAFVAIMDLKRLSLIKIDVEGFELDVLDGCARTLQRFKPLILLEFNHFCLTTQREMSPLDALRRIRNVFPYVSYFDRKSNSYRRISSERESMDFLRMHMLRTQVDDLLCSLDSGFSI